MSVNSDGDDKLNPVKASSFVSSFLEVSKNSNKDISWSKSFVKETFKVELSTTLISFIANLFVAESQTGSAAKAQRVFILKKAIIVYAIIFFILVYINI